MSCLPKTTIRVGNRNAIRKGLRKIVAQGLLDDESEGREAHDEPVVREFGRRVFEPETGDERLKALRLVLSSKEPAKIDGVFVEYHWARMILELYDGLGIEAQRQPAGTRISRVPELIGEWAQG
jgi:hypothetical protein